MDKERALFIACLAVACPLAGLITSAPSVSWSAQTADHIVRWAEQEQERLQAEKAELDLRYQQAQQALQRAQAALSRAEQANNPQASAVARQAVLTSEQALENVGGARQLNLNRLAGFERAKQWGLTKPQRVGGAAAGLGVITNFTPGEVFVLGPDRARERFDGGRPLVPGDTIRTSDRGRAEFRFDNGSTVILDQDTELKFESSSESRSLFRLFRGAFRGVFEPCFGCPRTPPSGGVRSQAIEYRTSVAIVSVRGTIFDLAQLTDGSSSLVVYEGEVELASDKRGNKVIVRKDERAAVLADGAIEGPVKRDAAEREQWWSKF